MASTPSSVVGQRNCIFVTAHSIGHGAGAQTMVSEREMVYRVDWNFGSAAAGGGMMLSSLGKSALVNGAIIREVTA